MWLLNDTFLDGCKVLFRFVTFLKGQYYVVFYDVGVPVQLI
jgi:hypothetical protein